MTYSEIIELTDKRNLMGIKPSLSVDEAIDYYGVECSNLIINLYKYLKKSNYIIYQHATDIESANDILKKGFIISMDSIDKIPISISSSTPVDIEIDGDGTKTVFYDGGQCDWRMSGIRDELSDTQHFFENTYCYLDFGSLTNPNINRSGIGTTLLFCVPNNIVGPREFIQYGIKEPHTDDWDDENIPETYFERHIIPKQFCIGYVDVENKRFVVNPSFQFNYGLHDEFEISHIPYLNEYTDLANALNNNKKSR